MKTHLHLVAVCLGLVALAGCHAAPEQPKMLLKDVKAAQGFTFANTRAIDIKVSAASSALPAGGAGLFSLSRADGRVIYRGTLGAHHPVHLQLPIPLADRELFASVIGKDGKPNSVSVPISGTSATYAFQ